MSLKSSSDTVGNRTRDLPACSAAPQPTAPPGVQIKFSFAVGTTSYCVPSDKMGVI